MRHAHGFCCERGHERVIKPKHERDAANDLVAIGYPVERADSVGCILELGQVLAGALEEHQKRARIIATKGEARFCLQFSACSLSQGDRQDTWALLERVSKKPVIARLPCQSLRYRGCLADGQLFDDGLDRRAVRFRKEDVERHHGRPFGCQSLYEVTDGGSRPRPLPEHGERLFVDIDDADGQVGVIGLRIKALIVIKRDQPQGADEEWVLVSEQERPCDQPDDHGEVEEALGTSVHGGPLRSRMAPITVVVITPGCRLPDNFLAPNPVITSGCVGNPPHSAPSAPQALANVMPYPPCRECHPGKPNAPERKRAYTAGAIVPVSFQLIRRVRYSSLAIHAAAGRAVNGKRGNNPRSAQKAVVAGLPSS